MMGYGRFEHVIDALEARCREAARIWWATASPPPILCRIAYRLA